MASFPPPTSNPGATNPGATGATLTPSAFRRSLLRPAEGVFLFHPRAIERIAGTEGVRGRGDALVVYHLIGKGPFLGRLEQENPEALTLIEGLPLPDWVILLPMPAEATLRTLDARLLLRDYWARRFEGEAARAWQMGRDDNQDHGAFGPDAWQRLVGDDAVAEAREVLVRCGIPGAAGDTAATCRAFVGRTARLRYFAPGSRGAFFPAVRDWRGVDAWLADSGLDLPPALVSRRLPRALELARPASTCGAPGVLLPLPADPLFDSSDPDVTAVASALIAQTARNNPRAATGAAEQAAKAASRDTVVAAASETERLCLAALHQGAAVRRAGGWGVAVSSALQILLLPLLVRVLAGARALGSRLSGARPTFGAGWLAWARIRLLGLRAAQAQRAEWDNQPARALRRIADARALYRVIRGAHDGDDAVLQELEQRRWAIADAFADLLAVRWHLSRASIGELGPLICRLAADDTSGKAHALLAHLETLLLAGGATYYRVDLLGWPRRGRLREVLPFQGTLKSLAALRSARALARELPWSLADMDRLLLPLRSLEEQVGQRLSRAMEPHLDLALASADLIADSPDERLAGARLRDAMAALIRTRGHLRFGDVRDLLNRDLASLPDMVPEELWRGDRLGRFDRAAARALPGVYRPGEPYVKGLQRLSAPLFGTPLGRTLLCWLILPWLAAWVLLEVVTHLTALTGEHGHAPVLSGPWALAALAVLGSLAANTGLGRRILSAAWGGVVAVARLLLVSLPLALLRSPPVTWLAGHPWTRSLWLRLALPVLLGLVPLAPVAAAWLWAMPEGPGIAGWIGVLAVAFALGTLLRETPDGRRRLDDIITLLRRQRDYLRHERLVDLIAPVMKFFEHVLRALGGVLHGIRMRLSLRLGESLALTLAKAVLAPLWGLLEALLRFYAVVLVEPQVNPIKHFPTVTIAHKLMLPFLPALTQALHGALTSVLPALIAVPIVGVTIALLPGLFGFLVWELKENWGLYRSNRRTQVPVARLGPHGETVTEMLRRGFHGGAVPKGFDRLREGVERMVAREAPDARALRRLIEPLAERRRLLAELARQELAERLRGAHPSWLIEIAEPGLATRRFELALTIRLPGDPRAARLGIELELTETGLRCRHALDDPGELLTSAGATDIDAAVAWMTRRCGAAGESRPVLGSPPRVGSGLVSGEKGIG